MKKKITDNKNNSFILIPSYQPEQTLIALSKSLHEHGFQILIVDDGSGEDYQYIFDECKGWSTVLVHHKNLGKGVALKTGFNHLIKKVKDFEYVLTVDGDGQHKIQDILKCYDRICKKHISIIGERHFDVKVPLKSKLGNAMSRFSQALCTLRYMRDNQCGLRAFPASLVPSLSKIGGNRYEYEMRVLTWFQMKEIPYQTMRVQTIYEDGNRTTHFRPFQDTLLIQGSIFLAGLVNLFAIAFNIVLATLLYTFLFKEGAPCANALSCEVAIIIASPITLLLQFFAMIIVFKPKNIGKVIFRLILYYLIMLVSNIISELLFTRILGLPIWCSLLICLPLSIVPIYYLIKGIGLVYNSQSE